MIMINLQEKLPPPQKYTSPPLNNYGVVYGGYGGGRRVNPKNLINDAINNHHANKKMEEKWPFDKFRNGWIC